MPNDAQLGPFQEKIRRISNEMIEKFGDAALREATQRKNRYESCGLSSEASTWGIVCTEIDRIETEIKNGDEIRGYLGAQIKGVMLSE